MASSVCVMLMWLSGPPQTVVAIPGDFAFLNKLIFREIRSLGDAELGTKMNSSNKSQNLKKEPPLKVYYYLKQN